MLRAKDELTLADTHEGIQAIFSAIAFKTLCAWKDEVARMWRFSK